VTHLKLAAPAKVNYRLDVIRRRPDGYHDLRMIMQQIDLCDTIDIHLSDGEGIRVACDREGVPDGPGNIAWRAADELLQLAAQPVGVDIVVTKRIPVAAGLGGGSSDCAAVLTGLNSLLGLQLTTRRLMEIGVRLGADVPFFIFGRSALAEGIGEQLTSLGQMPQVWLVLINPNIHVSTAWVYQNLQLTSEPELPIIPSFFATADDICAILGNDLESVTINRFPVIQDIKEQLMAEGACGALMSGSGPTVFGIFTSETSAKRTADSLAKAHGWFTAAVRTL
jgi:4-diphosphocytidyl-2-C-methyl-D-erythritol kinase